jgi:hypothetical protein
VITKESVKVILQINTNNHDPYIETMIPLLIDFGSEWCNNSFPEDDMPSGMVLFVSKAIEYLMNKSGVASRTMGNVSYSYDLDFPPAVMKFIKPYRRVRFS